MSTQENGLPATTIAGLLPPVTIVSSTNTDPIEITTSGAHGLSTGDFASVNLHTINTNANGEWPVTVLTGTSFSLDGSTGNGIGGATGRVQPRSFGPTFAIPSDGDAFTASAFNIGYEALADRTAAVGTMTGSMRIADNGYQVHADDTMAAWNSFTIAATNTWTDTATSSESTVFASSAQLVRPGDLISVDWRMVQDLSYGPVSVLPSEGYMMISLWYAVTPPGGTATYVQLSGSTQANGLVTISTDTLAKRFAGPIEVGGVISPSATGLLTVKLRGMFRSGSGAGSLNFWNLIGDNQMRAVLYRPTGMPQ